MTLLARLSRRPSSEARAPEATAARRAPGACASPTTPPAQAAPPPASVTASPGPPSPESAFANTAPPTEVLTHFHQLPAYHALLTVGPEAVYQLPASLHERLVALDTGARLARIVRTPMPRPNATRWTPR